MVSQALKNHGLIWRHVAFRLRNSIERWFRTLKNRTKRFYNNFQTGRSYSKSNYSSSSSSSGILDKAASNHRKATSNNINLKVTVSAS